MPQRSLQDIASAIDARILGDPAVVVSRLSSIASAEKGSLVFAQSAATLDEALLSPAQAIITGEFALERGGDKPLLICKQPKLGFAKAAELFQGPRKSVGLHPSALVDTAAKIHESATIGPYTIIEKGAQIGATTRIGSHCVIESGVDIGTDCSIGHNVTIHSGCKIGNRAVVQSGSVLGSAGFGYVRDDVTGRYHLFPQIGTLVVEDDVEIGANCTIDRGALDMTILHRGAKLDNMVHVGHNVEIGENVIIAAQTGVSGSSTIGSNAIVGGQVGIAEHVTIEEGVILGAQSGVPSNKVIRGKGIVFWGTPARPIREYLKELAMLARIAKRESK